MTCNSQIKKKLPLRSSLSDQLELIVSDCTQCQICVSQCSFLTQYGDPKHIASRYHLGSKEFFKIPFECSLCQLCTAVCPHNVDPKKMFLEMRREAFDQGQSNLPEHRRLRQYEKVGTSKRFSWYALPENCHTIFFPGCALSGTRSEITLQTYSELQKSIPDIGIVLDCCMKPSHDLGDQNNFNLMFNEMKTYLHKHGVKTILTACPNCLQVFTTYGTEFESKTVYEALNLINLPQATDAKNIVALHDPCTARFNQPAQDAVRDLLRHKGVSVEEQPHNRTTTVCCGEGGAVSCVNPILAKSWGQKRIDATQNHHIVSYCAGCTQTLGEKANTSHLLDIYFAKDSALTSQSKIAKPPLTYFKRLRLKKHLQNKLQVAESRERTFHPPTEKARHGAHITARKALILGSLVTISIMFIFKAWI